MRRLVLRIRNNQLFSNLLGDGGAQGGGAVERGVEERGVVGSGQRLRRFWVGKNRAVIFRKSIRNWDNTGGNLRVRFLRAKGHVS